MNLKPITAGVCAALSCVAFASSLPGFDFAYEIGGARQVAPLQIFDDGQYTYIQWATNVVVPTVAVTIDGKAAKPIAGSTPYYVVPGVGSVIEIRASTGGARATYVGQRGQAPMQVAARKAEQASAVAESTASLRAAPTSKTENWEITVNDRTLQGAMERWAKAGGYDLKWFIRDQMLIERGSTYAGSLPDVLATLSGEVGLQIALQGSTITVSEK